MEFTTSGDSTLSGDGRAAHIGFNLSRGQVISARKLRGLAIECTRGSVWITSENEGWDHVLKPGERMQLSCGGRVVVEALESSDFAVFHPATRPVPRFTEAGELSNCFRNWITSLTSHRLSMEFPL